MNPPSLPEALKPPVDRSMKVLDKSFFRKTVALAAASISDSKQISNVRTELLKSGDMLKVQGVKPLRDDDVHPGTKCLLLRHGVDAAQPDTWSPTISKLVEANVAKLRPYDLTLTYDDWSMQNILDAILPEVPDEDKETPAGFAQVGHVAHVNLRTQYLPYKHIIGQILVDKNATIKTVINKTFDVGTESVFRTFPYEVLAGPDDLDVTVHESGCEFKFNFGKVYWNSRLGTEHALLCEAFQEGEAVCDVMAGVGPFAIPAGKKRVFVHANDLNPDCFTSLKEAIQRNKVADFVRASCEDGRSFIRSATARLARSSRRVALVPKIKISRTAGFKRKQEVETAIREATRTLEEPRVFSHYVMNLPASAIEFLDAFRGTYHGREIEFTPKGPTRLPFIHLYLFQGKLDTEEAEDEEICQRISHHIGAAVKLDDPVLQMSIRYVRLVSPKKKMYCASFRIPPTVAFAQP